jgi:arabinogalactan oligomer/maltooligosaccharide transport system permease protein
MAVGTRRATAQAADGDVRGLPRAGRRAGRWSANWYSWAMVAPVVIVTVVLVGWPLARGIYLSLTDATSMNIGHKIGMNDIPASYKFVGLDNYSQILSSSDFWSRLTWTVVWTFACVALHVGLGLGLALLLNRPMRFRGAYRAILVLPWAVPAVVSAFIWRYLYSRDYGVLNAMLQAVGLPRWDWLGDPLHAKISVIMVNVWLGVPFMMVALLGGLQSIDGQLYEAAAVDGANPWQRFRNITLPGLAPVSRSVVLIGTIWTFNQFPVIWLVTQGGPGDSTNILVTRAYKEAFQGVQDFSGAAADGVIVLLLLVMMAIGYRRMLRRQGEPW